MSTVLPCSPTESCLTLLAPAVCYCTLGRSRFKHNCVRVTFNVSFWNWTLKVWKSFHPDDFGKSRSVKWSPKMKYYFNTLTDSVWNIRIYHINLMGHIGSRPFIHKLLHFLQVIFNKYYFYYGMLCNIFYLKKKFHGFSIMILCFILYIIEYICSHSSELEMLPQMSGVANICKLFCKLSLSLSGFINEQTALFMDSVNTATDV